MFTNKSSCLEMGWHLAFKKSNKWEILSGNTSKVAIIFKSNHKIFGTKKHYELNFLNNAIAKFIKTFSHFHIKMIWSRDLGTNLASKLVWFCTLFHNPSIFGKNCYELFHNTWVLCHIVSCYVSPYITINMTYISVIWSWSPYFWKLFRKYWTI